MDTTKNNKTIKSLVTPFNNDNLNNLNNFRYIFYKKYSPPFPGIYQRSFFLSILINNQYKSSYEDNDWIFINNKNLDS